MHHEAHTGPRSHSERIYQLPFHRLTLSLSIQRTLQDRFGCRIHDLVPCGVDGDVFFPEGEPEENTVLMIYHPTSHKGGEEGLEALELLRQRRPDLRVFTCGTVKPRQMPGWAPFLFHPSDRSLRRL